MSTIIDVAKLAGYSKSTVSRVINGNGPVSNDAEKKIKEAMKKLNYTPNYFAQGMRTNKTNNIAVLIPDYTNPFYPELVKSIENIARDHHYMVTICDTDEEAEREFYYIKQIIKRNIDGIIFCTYNRVRRNIDYLIQISNEIPVVFMDRVIDDHEPISYVITDGFNCTRKAASYLIEKGIKRIAYIKGSSNYRVTSERFEGYRQALNDYQIKFDENLIYTGDFHLESGWKGAKSLMNISDPPRAIMAATDVMAIGAMKYLKSKNISIPEEVNLIGFDNISLSTLVEPSLTTISQPISQLGQKAIEILINKIEDKNADSEQIELEGELIIRGTTELNKKSLNYFNNKDEDIFY